MPAFVAPSVNPTSQPGFSYIFGIFPTHYFHDAIGILVGIWGIATFTSLIGAMVFNHIFAILYGAAVILGFLPFANTLFGLAPLYGNNIWLNAITAVIAFYFMRHDCAWRSPHSAELHGLVRGRSGHH